MKTKQDKHYAREQFRNKELTFEMRNLDIYYARESGQTYTSLAEHYGVTPARIRQIYLREDLKKAKMTKKGEWSRYVRKVMQGY